MKQKNIMELLDKKIELAEKLYGIVSDENLENWNVILNLNIDEYLDYINININKKSYEI